MSKSVNNSANGSISGPSSYGRKRVLITGVTGMAGSHLADLLLAEAPEYEIVGTRRWRSSMDNVDHLQNRINMPCCDLTDPMATLRLVDEVRPDIIFHLAAQSFVPDSWRNPHATMNDNVMMQLNLFEAIRQLKLDPVIQIALSSEEYGMVHPDEVPINEKNPFRPLSPYAVSKVTQDMLAYQYYQSYGTKVIRTRAFNHEGPRRGDVFVTSNFARQIAEIELGLKPPVMYVGNLEAKRDWTDVRDMVRAYWLSVQYGEPGEDYVLASGQSKKVQEMLDCLLSLSTAKIEVVQDPARLRPSDVMILEGNPSKFVKLTGWYRQFTLEDTLRDLLDYWRTKLKADNSIPFEQLRQHDPEFERIRLQGLKAEAKKKPRTRKSI